MSVGDLGFKRAICDIWPVKNKKFFVLVDPHNIIGDTTDAQATLTTISYLLEKKGSVIIAGSYGPLSGIPMNLPRKQREEAIETFSREDGMGYSNFFFNIPSQTKMDILQSIPEYTVPPSCSVKSNTGKTSAFAHLTSQQKSTALRSFFPKAEFIPASTHVFVDVLRMLFPNVTVKFAPNCLRPPLHQLLPGEILVLENLQFYRNETSPDLTERMAMAEVLAANIDVFVNESFATAHTMRASNTALPKILYHGAAGLSMNRELVFFTKFCTHPSRPLAVVVAGTHIPEKLHMLRSLVGKVDRILIAGALEIPFLEAKGLTVGKTSVGIEMVHRKKFNPLKGNAEEESITTTQFAEEIIKLCEKHRVELVLPVDHLVTRRLLKAGECPAAIVESAAIPSDVYAVDCGPNTIALFTKYIRECQCVFWTGTFGWTTLGYTEGTCAFATMLAREKKMSILGGRSTARIVQRLGLGPHFSHISGGGVSCFEILQGHLLPGLEAISDVTPVLDSKAVASVDELLWNLPLFSGCTAHQIKAVSMKFVRRIHASVDYLIYQGDRQVSMWVVAHGALIAHMRDGALKSPSRYIGQGQAIGMYDFINGGFSPETVQAAENDTVTYQLTSSSFNDLLNEHPDLAIQILHNVSEPLRLIANEEYRLKASVNEIMRRTALCTRVPSPHPVSRKWGLCGDVVQDLIATVLFQRLTMQYTPYVPLSVSSMKSQLGGRMVYHQGFIIALGASVVRNIVYHTFADYGIVPSSLIAAVVCAPMRLMAMGTSWNFLTYKAMLDEMLVSSAVSWCPAAAHYLFLVLQRRLQCLQGRKCAGFEQLLLTCFVKVLIGILVFPVICQRSRNPSSMTLLGVFTESPFKSYELKQVLAVLLRQIIHLFIVVLQKVI